MPKKMLIDATHPEETRVVVVDGTKLEDFDFESAARKQLIGNIYLAKVTRIEPSLQAAFVDYGGNRHGFLAFSEIHPDYYQIPVADRLALLEADEEEEQRAREADEIIEREIAKQEAQRQAAENADEHDHDHDHDDQLNAADSGDEGETGEEEAAHSLSSDDDDDADDDDGEASEPGTMALAASARDSISSERLEAPEETAADDADSDAQNTDESEDGGNASENSGDDDAAPAWDPATGDQPTGEEAATHKPVRRMPRRRRGGRDKAAAPAGELRQDTDSEESVSVRADTAGGEDVLDEVSRPRSKRRHYKIQEVIKKRQIMLVQILKDERGSKGAALTTYLSIPGRYCVLMPNTARGGGISRKITNAVDRKRLKAVAAELEVPKGMGLIIRTAGANRTKTEIKRDFDYLLRQWETIRELTLRSSAPCLINEEGSIVKRAVRDLYDKDIESIQVAGEHSYREAKDFMRMLMPSHAKRVQPYREAVPLFQRFQIEAQLDSMFDPTVRLRSGGYIVINPTEALVSIDVNSGKATREANIEATALKTNMEAAEEVSRQLRLRDLAGLIVIDFIDMENSRNNKAVERKLKDCLASDRANIQVGRISAFGLMEMSRQRLRQGVVETTTRPCSNCNGTGLVRSVDSLALRVLRGVEEECQRRKHTALDILVPSDVAIYILNQKRLWLHEIEARAGCSIFVVADASIQSPNFEIKPSDRIAIIPPLLISAPIAPEAEAEEDDAAAEELEAEVIAETNEDSRRSGDHPRDRKRDRGQGRRDEQPRASRPRETVLLETDGQPASEEGAQPQPPRSEEETRRRRRRRGRGRGRDRDGTQRLQTDGANGAEMDANGAAEMDTGADAGAPHEVISIPIIVSDGGGAVSGVQEASPEEIPFDAHIPALAQAPEPAVVAEAPVEEAAPAVNASPAPVIPEAPAGPKRAGWWQRQFGNKV